MQIAKSVLLACVTAMVAFPLTLAAQDSQSKAQPATQMSDDAKNKALEDALLKSLSETVEKPAPAKSTTPAPATKTAAKTPQAKTETPATPKPAATPAKTAAAPAKPAAAPVAVAAAKSSETTASSAEDARNRELEDALRKALSQDQAQTGVAASASMAAVGGQSAKADQTDSKFIDFGVTAAPVAGQPAVARAATAAPLEMDGQYQMVNVQPTLTPEEEAKLQAAFDQAAMNLKSRQEAGLTEDSDAVQSKKNVSKWLASLPPIKGPDSPLSASKQQRLGALLQQYRDDMVSPEQYHIERAKILAEP